MGLDTRGLASGFAQGFGLMDNHYARQHQQEMQTQQNARAERQMGLQEEGAEMRREQFDRQAGEMDQQQDLEAIQFTLGKLAQGMEVDDTEIEVLQRYPKYWKALDPATDQSINVAERLFDPNDPLDSDDPEVLEAVNQMFDSEINQGGGGQKRIVGIYPGQDGESVTFDLEVVGEDGSPYSAPMTRNRGVAGEDDDVLQVPVADLIDQVQGMKMLRSTLRQPEAQQRASQVLGLMSGRQPEQRAGQPFEHPQLGWVQQMPDGTLKQYEERGPQGRGGSGQDPASIKAADAYNERLRREGREPLPFDEAFRVANTAMADPINYIHRVAQQDLKAQESMFLQPGDEGYRSPEKIRKDAIKEVRAIRDALAAEAGRGDDRVQGMDRAIQEAERSDPDDVDPDSFWGEFFGGEPQSERPAQESGEPRQSVPAGGGQPPQSISRQGQPYSGGQQQAQSQASREEPGFAARSGRLSGYEGEPQHISLADAILPEQAREAIANTPGRIRDGVVNTHGRLAAETRYNKYARNQRMDDKDIPVDVLQQYLPFVRDEKKRKKIARIIEQKTRGESVASR